VLFIQAAIVYHGETAGAERRAARNPACQSMAAHNRYDWSYGGDKIVHIHQALVRLMAVNMFPFCDKSGHRIIYAARWT